MADGRAPDWDRSYIYDPTFVSEGETQDIARYLETLHPIWEQRYGAFRPAPPGKAQRPLLRPVYWLGNWQFACLGYYEPPRIVHNAAVAAEPFPSVFAKLVARMTKAIHAQFHPADIPAKWHFNTCLINFYGERHEEDKWQDAARVGDHRDFEPGPVGSISLGARAFFQFVPRGRRDAAPVMNQWIDGRSFMAFGGSLYKDQLLHRVQRVERSATYWPPAISGFRTRRVNFTFRYVPDEHIVPFADLAAGAKADVLPYMQLLARHSPFFAAALRAR